MLQEVDWMIDESGNPPARKTAEFTGLRSDLSSGNWQLLRRGSRVCQRRRERDTKPADRNGSGVLAGGMKKAGGFFHRPAFFVTFCG
jgi:hypothetical protein